MGITVFSGMLMATLLGIFIVPVLFVVVKTSLVSGGTFLLWRHRDRPLAVVSIFVAFLAYYFLLAWHLEALWLAIQHFAGGS